MAKDVIITPLDGDIQFKNTSGTEAGKIEQSGDDLVLSNAVGDVLIGDGLSDVYIGDGVNNVDIIFEQDGSIRGESGANVTLTIGSADTSLIVQSPTLKTPTVDSKLTFTTPNGYLLFDFESGSGEYGSSVPLIKVQRDSTSSEQVILERTTENGGLILGVDDTVMLTAGDTKSTMRSNIGETGERVVVAAESGMTIYEFPNNDTSWTNRNTYLFQDGFHLGDGNSSLFVDLNRNVSASNINATGNLTIDGTTTFGGDLTVEGIVTAREFHTEFVSASIIYQSGSTQFGDTSDDIHNFIGSVEISQGTLTLKDGTSANLALNFSSSDSTGMYIQNYSGGGKQLFIKVGGISVGDFSPAGIASSANVYTATAGQFRNFGGVWKATTGQAGGDAQFILNGKTIMHLDEADEFVGIGTTNPQYKLHIQDGGLRATDSSNRTTYYNGTGIGIYSNTGGSITNYSSNLTISNTVANQDVIFKASGSVGLVEYFRLDGSNNGIYFSRPQFLADSVKTHYGASNDLEIFHDGSNSYIDEKGTGNLKIRSNSRIQLEKYTGETLAEFIADGAVNLYYNNNNKLETTNSGIAVTGRITITDNGTPISFIEGDNTGAGKYWRQVLDGGNIRFDVDTTSTNGDGSFSSYRDVIKLNNTGQVVLGEYGLGNQTGTAAKLLAITSGGTIIEEDLPGSTLDLSNGQDNRVVTAVDADSLNAEANLQYDGTKLLVQSHGHVGLQLRGGEAEHGSILFESSSFTAGRIGWHNQGYYAASAMNVNPSPALMVQSLEGIDLIVGNTGSLSIKSGSADVIIDSKVNVGIGIASPSYKLSVNGTVQTDLIRGLTYPDHSFLDFDDDQTASSNNTTLSSIARINYLADSNGNDGASAISHQFFTGTTDIDTATALMTLRANGKMGIGIVDPLYKLDISGEQRIVHSNANTGLWVLTNSDIPTTPQVKIGRDSGQWYGIMTEDSVARLIHRQDETGAGTHDMINEIWTSRSGGGVFQWKQFDNAGANGTEFMRLNSTGLGIGVTPSYKLDIDLASASDRVNVTYGGQQKAYIDANGSVVSYANLIAYGNLLSGGGGIFSYRGGTSTQTIGHRFQHVAGGPFSAASGDQTMLKIEPIISQSSTAGYTGLKVDVTETATGSGNKYLMDLQVGGTSKYSVGNTGDVTMAGDLTVEGIVTAREFHTEFVSASIIYQSGSTKFGDDTGDNHSFTGSILLSGSYLQNGASDNSGKADFGVLVGGSPTLALWNNQVNMGSSDANYEGKIYVTSTNYYLESWARDIEIKTNTSTTTQNIKFLTANSGTVTEKMRITGDGNVGIGTSSPNHKLDIYSNENVPLRIHRPSNANLDSSGAWGIGFSTRGDANNSTTDTRAGIFSYYNGDLFLAASNTSIVSDPDAYARLTVLSTGVVGIGTMNPSTLLHISSGTSGDAVLTIEADTDNNDENDNPRVEFKQDGGSLYAKIGLTGDGGGTDFTNSLQNAAYFGTVPNVPVQFFQNGTAQITIENGGNVGIGINNPAAKLDVAGSIKLTADGDIFSDGSITMGIDYNNNQTDRIFNIVANNTTELFRVQEDGRVTIGITSPSTVGGTAKMTVDVGSGTASPISIVNGTTDGMYIRRYDASGQYQIQTTVGGGNTGNLSLQSYGGNVGIGNTSPSAKLHVAGDVLIESAKLEYQDNQDLTVGTETVATVPIGSFDCAFFDYVIKSGTNLRAGTVTAVHDGTNVEHSEVSTNDIGDTSTFKFDVDINGSDMRLRGTSSGPTYIVKTLVRTL